MHRLHSKFWTTMLIAILLLPLGLQPIVGPTSASPSAPVVIRLYVNDKAHLDAVAGELDIWEAHRDAGYVVAAVTPEQLAWLQDLGYQTALDPEKTAWLRSDRAPLDPRYYYFSEFYSNPNRRYIVNFLQNTNAAYPELTELFDIGNTWQTTRDIWVLRITNEDAAFGPIADKPTFFLYATIHAREVSTPELAIRYIKYLLDGYNGEGGYGVDPDVTWLVDQHVLYVLVMANPDGHVVNEMNTSANRRKNMNNTLCPTGRFGVDLNRNHSFLWGCCWGSSTDPCNDTYRGVSRASEPETQAFQAFFAQVMRDQNGPNGDDQIPPAAPEDAMGIFITLHSYSDYVLWPWGIDNSYYGPSPNYTQLRAIGEKFAYFNGFNPVGYIGYAVDGATDDWTYGKFGIASFTFEVGPQSGACGGFFPAYGCIDGIDGMSRNFWAENKPAFLYAHKIAAAPYRIVYGPDALNVTLAPSASVVGDAITIQATIADRRHGNAGLRPVTAAEVFIGAPGADGTGIPMAPVDGSWGSTSEQARAVLDTGALAPGRHLVFVHGRNDQGKWGPFSTAFLDLEAPSPCIALTDASLAVLTPSPIYTDTLVAFEAALSPADFTAPYTYTLDFGAGPGEPLTGEANPITGMTHTFTSTGAHTATLTVWNCAADAASTATAAVDVLARPITLTHGVTLTPLSAARSSFPNAAVSYTLTVQNTGNGADTFDLSTTGEEAWPTVITPNVLTLAAEASRTITVTVTLGFDVIGSDIAHIVAVSRGAPTVEARATLHTTALPWKRLYLPLLVHDTP